MTQPTSQQVAERLQPNREVTDLIPVSQDDMRGALVPRNMGEAMECAKIMSTGRVSLPAFLRGNPGDCLRIVGIAVRTGLDPFMLANHFYLTKSRSGEERMAAEAQAVHAIAMASGLIHGDLKLAFAGQGQALACTVTGTTRNGTTHRHTYYLQSIRTKNSPLWVDQPQQQLGYYAERAWCRLYAPGAMMGVIARGDPIIDVSADEPGSEEPKSEADKVLEHLSGTPESGQKEPGGDEAAAAAAPTDESTTRSPVPAETKSQHRYSFTDCDGEVSEGLDVIAFAGAMKHATSKAPNKATLDGLWNSNMETMNMLRAGNDDERAIAAEVENAFDARDRANKAKTEAPPADGKLG